MADAESSERTLKLNGTDYDIESLSDEAKHVLSRLMGVAEDEQKCVIEAERLAYARQGYVNNLKEVIEKDEQGLQAEAEEPQEGDLGDDSEEETSSGEEARGAVGGGA